MKKTIYIMIIAIMGIASIGCDKRKDYMSKYNKAPDFGIREKSLGGSYHTSLSDSFWMNSPVYICEYQLKDEPKDVDQLAYTVTTGAGNLVFDQGLKQIKVTGFTLGKNIYELTATDKYGVVSTCNLEIVAFANRAPYARLVITQTNLHSPREINISAATSFDYDSPYGDFLTGYDYKVGTNYVVNTPYDNINYVAAATGTVMVYLNVTDSQGAVSVKDSVKFTVN